MKKLYSLIILSTMFLSLAMAQATNPTAQNLPYSFTSLTGTALPAGMAAHKFSSIPTTRTTTNGNADLPQGCGGTGGWCAQSADGVSLLGSGSQGSGAIVVAINTTGLANISVSWKAGTILQQSSRDHSLALQYRVGTSGNWIDVGTTSTYTSQGQTAGHSSTYSETLPSGANNQSVVQVRWIYWESNGSAGSRDRINIDEIAIAGNSSCSAPGLQATNINVTPGQTSATISWTNGDGANRAVFVKQTNTGDATPADNTTYTASTNFGSGTQIGSTGWYCVYNGTGTSVTVANLSSSTTYRVMVVDYNCAVGSEKYITTVSANNPFNFTTSAISPDISVSGLTSFGTQCVGGTYGPNSFTITGVNLTTANVTIAALSGYTYSTSVGGTYSSSLSIPQGGGAFSQTIYVKFSPVSATSYSGNIVVGGGGATNMNVTASGSGSSGPVINTQPTNQSVSTSSSVSFNVIATNVTSYQWQELVSGAWQNTTACYYQGATTATLNVLLPPVSVNGTRYRCILSNGCGSDTTNENATLTVTASTASVLWSNSITGSDPGNSNPYTSGQSVTVGITVSGIGRGSGISGNVGNDRYNAAGWSSGTLNTGDYFYFTLTPLAGFEIDFTSLVYTAQRSSSGPRDFAMRSSLDGYTTDIATPGVTGTIINLGAFQNVTSPITFRLYGYNSDGGSGTYSINDFTFNGKVSVPTFYKDVDNDGYSDGQTQVACSGTIISGYKQSNDPALIATTGDCDDNNSAYTTSCPAAFTWTGAINSQWNNNNNWSPAGIPNACFHDVVIPNTSNKPVITGATFSVGNLSVADNAFITIQNAADSLRVCGNVEGGTTDAGSIVGLGRLVLRGTSVQEFSGVFTADLVHLNNAAGATFAAGAELNVGGVLELRRGVFNTAGGTLTFKSINETYAAIADNFSVGFTGSILGSVKAERGYAAAAASSLNKQHFFSSPLNNVSITQFAPAKGTNGVSVTPKTNCDETATAAGSNYGNVFEFDESKMTSCHLEGWVVRSTGNTENGKGYSVVKDGAGVLTLTGTLNTANYNLSGLNNNGFMSPQPTPQNNTYYGGWHLLGNPYLASLDLDYTSNTSFDNTVQVLHVHGPYAGTFQPVTMSSTSIVAPFQGFFVKKTLIGGAPSIFNINASSRRREAAAFHKNGEHQLSLQVIGNGFADITYFNFDANATDGYDPMYDGGKMSSYNGQPTLYSLIGAEWASINTNADVQSTPSIPLGFVPGANGTFMFQAEGFADLQNTTVYLEDKKDGSMHNLTAIGDYTFTATTADSRERFVLHFNYEAAPSSINNVTEAGSIHIFSNQNKVVVDISKLSNNSEVTQIEIYSLIGEKLFETKITEKVFTKAMNNTSAAYLVVKASNGEVTTSKKVFLVTK